MESLSEYMKYIIQLISCLFLILTGCLSQNYHAVQGSSYAGVLGASNNPASIVNIPDAWNITPFAAQYKSSTNAVTVINYSYLSSAKSSQYRIDEGDFSRYANGNFNLHLLNARIALNRRHVIAVGMNMRGYSQVRTGRYNFIDTINSLRSFLKVNDGNEVLEGNLKSSTWLEIFGTYSRTIWDGEGGRLNGGITVKAMRGMSGAFANVQQGGFVRNIQNNQPTYFLNSARATYGYSSNLDNIQKSKTVSQNLKDVVAETEPGLSFDLGIEYLVKLQAVTNYYDDEDYFDYEWKIGISLLDLGSNHYKYSRQSRRVANAKENLSDRVLERKFNQADIQAFNDSLVGVFNNVQPLAGRFAISNPARLVVNVDRNIYDDFYLNGELSVNLSPLAGKEALYTTELNVLTLTPRWETKRYGVYLPMQFNTEKQFWVGGAFKAGPLLVGIHNWMNLFAKNKIQNGGGYLAFIIRPGRNTKSPGNKGINCP